MPAAFQALHLPRLQIAQVLLAEMHTTQLVTHGVSRNVLLGPVLEAAGLLHGGLEHVLLGLLHAAKTEVHPGTHLLDLDTGELLAAALGADEVDAQADGGLCVALPDVVLGGDGHNVLQALGVNLVRGIALEEVNEHALGERKLIRHGALKRRASKEHHRPQAHGKLLRLELRHGAERFGIEVQLQHVEDLVPKGADESDGMGPLLLAAAKDEEAGVVLVGEELERGRVLKGVDGVLLCEFLGERLA